MQIELEKINIRSKNELAKHFSSTSNHIQMLKNINLVIKNFWKYYYNHKNSIPKEWKYIRVSKWPLRVLNKLVNEQILKKIDKKIPNFIFGWISGKNHIKAVQEHKVKRNRTYIKLDLKRYFDQIDLWMVIGNLITKLWCWKKWAKVIGLLCCVPQWEFFNDKNKRLLARWFNTSSRLAVLCSLDFFQRINWMLLKKYKHLKPKISVYVDDITISLNNTSKKEIKDILNKIYSLSEKYNLVLNKSKEEVIEDTRTIEILWIKMQEWKLSLWKKSYWKKKEAYKKWLLWDKLALKSIIWYKNYTKTLTNS